MFGPYAVFHLVFQETVTVRYALPLVIPLAYLASAPVTDARPLAGGRGRRRARPREPEPAVPATVAYAGTPSPIFWALADMRTAADSGLGRGDAPARLDRVASGAAMGRQAAGPAAAAPRDYEWLELTRAWRERDAPATWFLADPRRTDTRPDRSREPDDGAVPLAVRRRHLCRRRAPRRDRSGHDHASRMVPRAGLVARARSGGHHRARRLGPAPASQRRMDPSPAGER